MVFVSKKEYKDQKLKKEEIIRGRLSFKEILKNGKKTKGKYMTLFYLPAKVQKVGFIVSRKYKNAIQRNRLRRLLRDVYRKHKDLFPEGKMLFYAKHFNNPPNYHNLLEDVKNNKIKIDRC